MISAALLDDDTDFLLKNRDMLKKYGEISSVELDLHCYHTPEELLRARNSRHFDIYFFDIIMPSMNGIELGKQIRAQDSDCLIIYLTVSEEYALAAYQVFSFQYLIKPFSYETLSATMDRAITTLSMQKQKKRIMPFKTSEGTVPVDCSLICYVEYFNHRMLLHLTDHTTLLSITCREPFSTLAAAYFPKTPFIRIHASFLINMDHITHFQSSHVVMNDGASLTVSRKYALDFKQKYLDYLMT